MRVTQVLVELLRPRLPNLRLPPLHIAPASYQLVLSAKFGSHLLLFYYYKIKIGGKRLKPIYFTRYANDTALLPRELARYVVSRYLISTVCYFGVIGIKLL